MDTNIKRRDRQPVGFTVQGVVAAAGGPAALARELEITAQSVHNWTKIPTRHARRVAVLAGLPLAVVRPDLAVGE